MKQRAVTCTFVVLVGVGAAGLGYLGHALAAEDTTGFEPLPAQPPIPPDNPMSRAKIELGKRLYFDPRLSINATVACQSCHNVMESGTTNLPVPFGVYGRIDGDRQDPTVWNAAFKSAQFWDGRAHSLEEQAKGPLFNPLEMGITPEKLVARVKAIPGYADRFEAVFGGPEPVTVNTIVKAIAAYERTLVTPDGPFDRFLKGRGTISPAARRGMRLTRSAGCTACHSGPNFTGPLPPQPQGHLERFPMFTDNVYVKKYDLMADLGRYDVTHEAADKHLWIVQTWRNIELTAPYFHNGSVKDLSTAIRVMGKTQLNRDLTGDEVKDIGAFFATLTGAFPRQMLPRLPATPGTTLLMDVK